ncbi:MAG TPA: DNA polymerase III subunit delta' [Blastocatellia bacterium]|jgi:DNA polymerase-3 subunit delta'|nr:DNA polymerase III subunit delta' [Blastocatellia bacterium]
MSFARLVGNQRNKEILQRLLKNGRINSTLIFAGPDGVGKRQFALAFAKAVNCQRAPAGAYAMDGCEECSVCRRINAGGYGDVTVIRPDGQFIKIAQTREMAEEVYFRPREGRQRFFIVDEADRLREEAANSLLKTLEEPPSTSTIMLVTARPDALLLTIRSRAQRLNFAALSAAEMEKYLAENYPRPAPDTALLARITEGRIGQATAFDLSVYRQERRTLIELLELLVSGNDRHRLLKAAEYIGKKEREDFEKEIALILSLLRDLFMLAAGRGAESVINIDSVDRLRPLAQKIGLRRLMTWVKQFDQLRARLRININRQIATEAALLALGEAPPHQTT